MNIKSWYRVLLSLSVSNLLNLPQQVCLASDRKILNTYDTDGPNIVQENAYYPFGGTIGDFSYNASENRYGYNGKEQIKDFDLNLVDLGQRLLNPQIIQLSTLDRFAEKYYSISPYAFCMGNPIKNIDVNGDWILIKHEELNYRYDNGKLYQYQTEGDNAGQYTECTPDAGSFLEGLLSGLNDLSKNETGKTLLDFFANDDNNAYLSASSGETKINYDPDPNNKFDINKISVNENFKTRKIMTEKGQQQNLFWLELGHELAHRQDFIMSGSYAKQEWLKHKDDGSPIPVSEQNVSVIENCMRKAAGLSLRTHYATQGKGGWEKSRIIDKKGNSIFFPAINFNN